MENNKVEKTYPSKRFYFVDEGGDTTLFAKKGKVLVDTNGCSRFFIVGMLDILDPEALQRDVDTLRTSLTTDPYFKGVPSMSPEARKTARVFHAKDDVPEVRREVFRLLHDYTKGEGLRFYAVVADKLSMLEYVRKHAEKNKNYRYHPNELYGDLTKLLFKERLGPYGECDVILSKREKFDRSEPFNKLAAEAGTRSKNQINIISTSPHKYAGLQAVDYFVWTLQRLYERGEDRYLAYLWEAFRQVHDIDDTREGLYGVNYTQKRKLTAESLRWRNQE